MRSSGRCSLDGDGDGGAMQEIACCCDRKGKKLKRGHERVWGGGLCRLN